MSIQPSSRDSSSLSKNSSLNVIEDVELKPGIRCLVVYDEGAGRIFFNVTNKTLVDVEVRFDWTTLDNLRVLTAYDLLNYKLFEVDGNEGGADSSSLLRSNILDRTDSLGRTVISPNGDILCAVLALVDPSKSNAFNYAFKLITTDTLTTLPAVTRVIEATEIRPGVFVRALWYGSLRQMHLTVHNERDIATRLKLVWSSFENMRVLVGAAGDLYVAPRSMATYAVMSPSSRSKPWRYRYSFRVVSGAVAEPVLADEIRRANTDRDAHIAAFTQALCYHRSCAPTEAVSACVDLSEADALEIQQQHKTAFVDLSFPPDSRALALPPPSDDGSVALPSDPAELSLSIPVKARAASWKRLGDLIGAGATLLENIDPADVRAGPMDGWFAGTIAALAEQPELIARCFVTKTVSPTGRYELSLLNPAGERVSVVIDDYIPVSPLTGSLFTRGHGNALWPALLHKAYCKTRGSMARVLTGSPHLLMNALTGCPVDALPLRASAPLDDVWDRLCRHTQAGAIMAVQTDRVDAIDTGLRPRAVYTVLGAVPQQSLGDPRLVLLRAPLHPGSQWRGAWGPACPQWQLPQYAHLRALAPVQQVLTTPDAQELLLPLEALATHCRALSLCAANKDWQELRVPTLIAEADGAGADVVEEDDGAEMGSVTALLRSQPRSTYLLSLPTATPVFAALHQHAHARTRPAFVLICALNPGAAATAAAGDGTGADKTCVSSSDVGAVWADSSTVSAAYSHAEHTALPAGTYIVIVAAMPHTDPASTPTLGSEGAGAVLAVHARCPLQLMPVKVTNAATLAAVCASVAKHGVSVGCSVPGLVLADWCARKAAYFSVSMTPDFFSATGRSRVRFTHTLTQADNVHAIAGMTATAEVGIGQTVLLNIAGVIDPAKKWRYKHKWEFVYVEDE